MPIIAKSPQTTRGIIAPSHTPINFFDLALPANAPVMQTKSIAKIAGNLTLKTRLNRSIDVIGNKIVTETIKPIKTPTPSAYKKGGSFFDFGCSRSAIFEYLYTAIAC